MVKLILKAFPPGQTRWKRSITIIYIQQYIWEPNQNNQEEKETTLLSASLITSFPGGSMITTMVWSLT